MGDRELKLAIQQIERAERELADHFGDHVFKSHKALQKAKSNIRRELIEVYGYTPKEANRGARGE